MIAFIAIGAVILATVFILLNVFDAFETRTQFLATNITIPILLAVMFFGVFVMARERMSVSGNTITARRAFGRKVKFTFADIIEIKERTGYSATVGRVFSYKIFASKHVFTISPFLTNFATFMQIVHQKGIPVVHFKV